MCVCISQKLRSARTQKRLLFVGSLALTGKYGRTHSQSSLAERVIQILHKHTHANTLQGLAYMSSRRARCGPAFAQRGPHASQRACTRGCVQMVHVNMSVRRCAVRYRNIAAVAATTKPTSGTKMAFTRRRALRAHTMAGTMCVYMFLPPMFSRTRTYVCVCSGKCVC